MKRVILIGVITLLPTTLLGQSKVDTVKKAVTKPVEYKPNPSRVYILGFSATIDDINLIVFGLQSLKPKIDETDYPYKTRVTLKQRIDYFMDSIKTQYVRQYTADSIKSIKQVKK